MARDEDIAGDELARSLRTLDRSALDIRTGRTQPAKQAVDEIAEEFGLALERRPAAEAQLTRDVAVMRRALQEIRVGQGLDVDAALDPIRADLLAGKTEP